jgi:hypothetical protein
MPQPHAFPDMSYPLHLCSLQHLPCHLHSLHNINTLFTIATSVALTQYHTASTFTSLTCCSSQQHCCPRSNITTHCHPLLVIPLVFTVAALQHFHSHLHPLITHLKPLFHNIFPAFPQQHPLTATSSSMCTCHLQPVRTYYPPIASYPHFPACFPPTVRANIQMQLRGIERLCKPCSLFR